MGLQRKVFAKKAGKTKSSGNDTQKTCPSTKKVSLRRRKEARRHSEEMHASAMNRGAENEVCPDYDIAATCWRWIRAKIRQMTCTTHRCRSDCPAETEGKKAKE